MYVYMYLYMYVYMNVCTYVYTDGRLYMVLKKQQAYGRYTENKVSFEKQPNALGRLWRYYERKNSHHIGGRLAYSNG